MNDNLYVRIVRNQLRHRLHELLTWIRATRQLMREESDCFSSEEDRELYLAQDEVQNAIEMIEAK